MKTERIIIRNKQQNGHGNDKLNKTHTNKYRY